MQEEAELIRVWHNAGSLATPGARLLLRMTDGTIISGSRPGHIVRARGDQPNYIDSSGQPVTPVAWAYE